MKKDWWNKEFRVMMILGASIVAGGWSSTRERCWANLLAELINNYQRTPVHLINLGIGANVISRKSTAYPFSGKPAADERLNEHVFHCNANKNHIVPDLLILAYGLNDARGGTPLALFLDELELIINRIRMKINPLIVCLGPYYITDFQLGGPEWSHSDLNLLETYNQSMKQCADHNSCLFVDLLSAYNHADWLVHHDGAHANDLGHQVIANRIFEVLSANCSGLAQEALQLPAMIRPGLSSV